MVFWTRIYGGSETQGPFGVRSEAGRCFTAGTTGALVECLMESLQPVWDECERDADFKSYRETRLRANREYRDSRRLARKCNAAGAGYFSSDRSVSEYVQKIWKL